MKLRVENLQLGFAQGRHVVPAVDGLSFTVAAGETYALLGDSGCGKSVSALALARLLPPAGRVLGGQVLLQDDTETDLLRLPEAAMREVRGRQLAMIFQEPATSLNPVLTVGQQLDEALRRHPQHGQATPAQRQTQAAALLRRVGLADPERRLAAYPFQLSGGMKQRVMIALALAGEPAFLLADEPTTALDVTIQAQILDLLAELQAEHGMGMVLITHDLGVVARSADTVGVMYAGQLIEEAPRERFFIAPAHPYSRQLFAALPGSAKRGQRLATLPGRVPPPGSWPVGCRFAERCPQAEARCREVMPDWHELPGGGRARCHLLGESASAATVTPAIESAIESTTRPPLSETPVLAVRDLQVHFPVRQGLFRRAVGAVRAVDGVSLTLRAGETLALVGESGCGKTTVGKAILRLLEPTGGSVHLLEQELTGRSQAALRPLRRHVQMVFQDPFASLNPRLSIGQIIAEGMQTLTPLLLAEQDAAIARLLEQVGLDPAVASRYPHEFSGGQRQRIAIARALAVQPEVLVCDEPTSALDVSVQAQILNLLRDLQDQLGLAYLFVTHNFAVVEQLADRVAVMYLGRIVEEGLAEEVLQRPRHPYTQALLAAVPQPSLTPAGEERRPLGGEMPSPLTPPVGCHFHPRCPLATEACRANYPVTVPLTATHRVACIYALD